MKLRTLHYFSGATITLFVGLHLFNHAYSIFGAAEHIALMQKLRVVYRNPLIESVLLLSVLLQIVSGIQLFLKQRKFVASDFDKLHVWSGLYLAFFFVIHLSAVLGGRLFLHLDTNFYFGVAGLNTFPFNLFFVPYYALAMVSFFGHVAAIHSKKMKQNIVGFSPKNQAKAILLIGICFTLLVFYGLTNHFQGVEIPSEFGVLIGKKYKLE